MAERVPGRSEVQVLPSTLTQVCAELTHHSCWVAEFFHPPLTRGVAHLGVHWPLGFFHAWSTKPCAALFFLLIYRS
jgi:hypothetical protein